MLRVSISWRAGQVVFDGDMVKQEATLSQSLYDNPILKKCSDVLDTLLDDPLSVPFRTKVHPIAHSAADYYDRIVLPMDLGLVHDRIRHGYYDPSTISGVDARVFQAHSDLANNLEDPKQWTKYLTVMKTINHCLRPAPKHASQNMRLVQAWITGQQVFQVETLVMLPTDYLSKQAPKKLSKKEADREAERTSLLSTRAAGYLGFNQDVLQVFKNCASYNTTGTEMSSQGKKLAKVYMELFDKHVLNPIAIDPEAKRSRAKYRPSRPEIDLLQVHLHKLVEKKDETVQLTPILVATALQHAQDHNQALLPRVRAWILQWLMDRLGRTEQVVGLVSTHAPTEPGEPKAPVFAPLFDPSVVYRRRLACSMKWRRMIVRSGDPPHMRMGCLGMDRFYNRYWYVDADIQGRVLVEWGLERDLAKRKPSAQEQYAYVRGLKQTWDRVDTFSDWGELTTMEELVELSASLNPLGQEERGLLLNLRTVIVRLQARMNKTPNMLSSVCMVDFDQEEANSQAVDVVEWNEQMLAGVPSQYAQTLLQKMGSFFTTQFYQASDQAHMCEQGLLDVNSSLVVPPSSQTVLDSMSGSFQEYSNWLGVDMRLGQLQVACEQVDKVYNDETANTLVRGVQAPSLEANPLVLLQNQLLTMESSMHTLIEKSSDDAWTLDTDQVRSRWKQALDSSTPPSLATLKSSLLDLHTHVPPALVTQPWMEMQALWVAHTKAAKSCSMLAILLRSFWGACLDWKHGIKKVHHRAKKEAVQTVVLKQEPIVPARILPVKPGREFLYNHVLASGFGYMTWRAFGYSSLLQSSVLGQPQQYYLRDQALMDEYPDLDVASSMYKDQSVVVVDTQQLGRVVRRDPADAFSPKYLVQVEGLNEVDRLVDFANVEFIQPYSNGEYVYNAATGLLGPEGMDDMWGSPIPTLLEVNERFHGTSREVNRSRQRKEVEVVEEVVQEPGLYEQAIVARRNLLRRAALMFLKILNIRQKDASTLVKCTQTQISLWLNNREGFDKRKLDVKMVQWFNAVNKKEGFVAVPQSFYSKQPKDTQLVIYPPSALSLSLESELKMELIEVLTPIFYDFPIMHLKSEEEYLHEEVNAHKPSRPKRRPPKRSASSQRLELDVVNLDLLQKADYPSLLGPAGTMTSRKLFGVVPPSAWLLYLNKQARGFVEANRLDEIEVGQRVVFFPEGQRVVGRHAELCMMHNTQQNAGILWGPLFDFTQSTKQALHCQVLDVTYHACPFGNLRGTSHVVNKRSGMAYMCLRLRVDVQEVEDRHMQFACLSILHKIKEQVQDASLLFTPPQALYLDWEEVIGPDHIDFGGVLAKVQGNEYTSMEQVEQDIQKILVNYTKYFVQEHSYGNLYIDAIKQAQKAFLLLSQHPGLVPPASTSPIQPMDIQVVIKPFYEQSFPSYIVQESVCLESAKSLDAFPFVLGQRVRMIGSHKEEYGRRRGEDKDRPSKRRRLRHNEEEVVSDHVSNMHGVVVGLRPGLNPVYQWGSVVVRWEDALSVAIKKKDKFLDHPQMVWAHQNHWALELV